MIHSQPTLFYLVDLVKVQLWNWKGQPWIVAEWSPEIADFSDPRMLPDVANDVCWVCLVSGPNNWGLAKINVWNIPSKPQLKLKYVTIGTWLAINFSTMIND